MKYINQIKLHIAQEAARIIVDEGITDYLIAKKKAAKRLNISCTQLPRNEEVETALYEHHRIYRSASQPSHIKHLRQIALEAMNFFEAFSPRLVGGVADGTAGQHSPITLHIHPPTVEDALLKLKNAYVPFTEKTHTVSLPNHSNIQLQAFHLVVDDAEVIVLVLSPGHRRNPPFGKNLLRAGMKQIKNIMIADDR